MLTKIIKNIIFGCWEGDKQIVCSRRQAIFETANLQNCISISNCTTEQNEGYAINRKNVPFEGKYQASFNPGFWIERSEKFLYFCMVRYDGRKGGGKILAAKIRKAGPKRFVDVFYVGSLNSGVESNQQNICIKLISNQDLASRFDMLSQSNRTNIVMAFWK